MQKPKTNQSSIKDSVIGRGHSRTTIGLTRDIIKKKQQQSKEKRQTVIHQINIDTFKNITISKRRLTLTKHDKNELWRILRDSNRSERYKELQKPNHHRRLWLKCSDAMAQKISNPGYYESLKKSAMVYPNPCFGQIEVDLDRTFPHITDQAQLESFTTPLRNVLTAFIIRNPTVGYCQGMNFIAARLLVCMSEEEAFWTLNQIIEKYLPLDYYSNMVGVLVDQKVLQIFMQKRLPKLVEHLAANDFSLDLVAFQWIVCLFASNLP